MNERPINMELFSCSGGMAEGFRRAGIEFDFVFDYDEDACNSYEQNLKHRPVRMDVRDLVRMARGGWRPGDVGLLVADPPCTPWSRAGKRLGTEDERDMLEETAELIVLLRPRAYLIGNVPGLQDSTSWHVVQRVIGGLQKHGYCVADYATLDAADYGVPQHRIRPFWFGHLDGPCVRWPAPSHSDPWHPALPGLALRPWVTCRKALQHLPLEDLGRPVRLKRRAEGHPPCEPEGLAPTLRGGGDGHSAPQVVLEAPVNHPFSRLDEPSFTIKCNGGRAAQASSTLMLNDGHPVSSLDEPARGIRANRANTGAQGGAALRIDDPRRPPEDGESPARTIVTQARNTHLLGDWPWDQPATTVCADERLAPPGTHDRNGSILTPPELRGSKKKRPPPEIPQRERIYDPDRPSPAVLTDTDREGKSCVKLDWPWDRPGTTVCAGVDKIAPPNEHAGHLGPNAVILSERAAAILQGFPESWVFSGATKKARWAQIGMAMPPPLAEAVARAIRTALDAQSSKVGT